jgi:peptide/nickel transport system permease protein
MAMLTVEQGMAQETTPAPRRPPIWLSGKLVVGCVLIGAILLFSLIGRFFWDTGLARVATSPLNLPPFWLERGTLDHPLGTENSGRDMLALMIAGAPATLRIGLIVGLVSTGVGILLGFTGGYLGGWADYVIRTLSDTALTIPSLAILIVISSYVREINVNTMALIVALFAWAGPTRVIRSQVLTLREQGYVKMARISGLSTFDIMFKEMMPNMLPYLAASFVGSASSGILAAVGLEALGLGPQRVPTLGMTIYYALEGSSILRGMWWWWGTPTLILVLVFAGFFLITIGLDEIANPRLRGANA